VSAHVVARLGRRRSPGRTLDQTLRGLDCSLTEEGGADDSFPQSGAASTESIHRDHPIAQLATVSDVSSLGALLATNLAVSLGCMLALWGLSVRTGDPSFIDAWWPMGFVVVAWVSYLNADGDSTRMAWLLGLTTLWGLRLGGYLLWRWRKNGADRRYVNMMRHAPGNSNVFTLKKVFLLQGALLWVVSLPLQFGQWYEPATGMQPLGYIGVVVAVIGIAFESIGDAQLVRFKANPASAGLVMDRGLWRYTRHPNYFGDSCFWWGIWLVALVNLPTAAVVVSPLVMTFLLARWSGVGPLERGLKRHRPGYLDYIERTSGFVPLPPKKRSPATANTSPTR
jgi:steroid 5-alpha reductase family enzyme